MNRQATAFDVDPQGLCSTLKRRKRWLFSLFLELLQNALDADDVSRVEIETEWLGKARSGRVMITDDSPEGFRYLAHAYTLFARSTKVEDTSKRGVFNVGEKMVIAACRGGAKIETTKGGVSFDPANNTRSPIRDRRQVGSKFEGKIPCLKDEWTEAVSLLETVIVPEAIKVVLNGHEIRGREPETMVEISALPTVRWDEESGQLKQTARKAVVEVYESVGDEVPMIYELGLPVMESGDKWHYNVLQRVPLNLERDSVPRAFLTKIRTAVLEELAKEIEPEEAADAWVQEAAANTTDASVLNEVLDLQYGKKRVWFDPNDMEANQAAQADGYTVLKGNQVPAGVRKNIRAHGVMLSAGKTHPTEKHASGEPSYPQEKWTEGMYQIVGYTKILGQRLLGFEPGVRLISDVKLPILGSWGDRRITFNVGRLGKKWFGWDNLDAVNELIVHEFSHHFEANHLAKGFADANTKLGVKLWRLALKEPALFSLDVLERVEVV